MSKFPQPSEQNLYLVDHVNLLRQSLQHYTGQELITTALSPVDAAKELYYAPFILVSHDTAPDPIFTYGNQAALNLFEMSWQEFTALPSRQSAEPPNQAERSRLLEAVTTQGFIKDYSGIRISKGGRRFWIEQATVWNLIDREGQYAGQAAVYSHWTYL